MAMPDLETFLKEIGHGEPSTDECGRGMHLCFRNAEALLNDAQMLKGSGSPRALSLAVLALEEIGKIFLLCEAAAKSGAKPTFWSNVQRRFFGSHQKKQSVFASYGSSLLSEMKGDGKPYYEVEFPAGAVPLVDKFKQWAFYVDFVDGAFQAPEKFAGDNEEWTEWILAVAAERLESIRPMHITEETSISVARGALAIAGVFPTRPSADEVKAYLTKLAQERSQPNNAMQPTPEDGRG
jgi:AbiV family abortive infection protein